MRDSCAKGDVVSPLDLFPIFPVGYLIVSRKMEPNRAGLAHVNPDVVISDLLSSGLADVRSAGKLRPGAASGLIACFPDCAGTARPWLV